MIVVFDTSALIKRYIAETDSNHVNTAWSTAKMLCASWITEAEMLATFARKRREAIVNPADLGAAEYCFLADWPTFVRVEPYRISSLLPMLHRTHPLRGADSIHLATALTLRNLLQHDGIIFGTADDRLIKAAKTEGLEVMP
ncbi:putative PIN domain-containing protein [Gammaproteobacteria bacterium]